MRTVADNTPDEDDDPRVVKNVLLGKAHVTNESAGDDPFLQKGEHVKTLSGVSSNTKRRVTNQITKRHRGAGTAHSTKNEFTEVTGYFAFDVVLPPYNLDYLAKIYELSAPHYAAVNAKVSNIVGLGFTLIESLKTKRTLEELEGDKEKTAKLRKKLLRAKEDLLEKIDELHEEDTFVETLTKVWRDYEATGNGYLEIGRKSTGEIGYIGHIPSPTMRIRKERDGYVQIIGSKLVFFRNFGDPDKPNPIGDDHEPNEVIHIKKYSPSSTYYGVPDIVAAKNAVAGNEFAARFNLDFFENKAVPRHIIILKGAELGTQAQINLLEFFETGLKGKNHRTMFIPLPGDTVDEKVDLKIEPVEAGVQDSSFSNFRKGNLSDILMAHRVPISKVSLTEGSLAAARDADKTFKEQVCQPEQRVFEKKLNKVLKEFTDIFVFKLNELSLTDADTQSKIDEREVRNGIRLPNEVRAEKGLPGYKGGEVAGGPMTAQKQADARATAQQSRQRDRERSAEASDSSGEARQPKGEGRASP